MKTNFCLCGCGKEIPLKDKRGRIKKFHKDCFTIGRPLSKGAKKYLSLMAKSPQRLKMSIEKINKVNKEVKEGKRLSGRYIDGYLRSREDVYLMIKRKNHLRANKQGYVFEHILVMEKKLKRKIKRHETVHHLNRIRNDNRPENLYLCSTESEHQQIHAKEDNRRDDKGRFVSYNYKGGLNGKHIQTAI